MVKKITIKIAEKIAEEWILSLSLTGLITSSLYLKRLPVYDKTDFQVVYIIFIFLVIIKGIENTNFLDAIAVGLRKGRWLSIKLVMFTALLSMFVTNDVAIFTIVPITLALDLDDPGILVILETLAANSASALSPFGNPQNIFIYFHYHLHPMEFISTIAPFCIVALVFTFAAAWRNYVANIDENKTPDKIFVRKACIYLVFFAVFILAALNIIPLTYGLCAIIYSLLFDRKSLSIDWVLLATFLVFFGFTDNLTKLINLHLNNPLSTFIYTSFGSQIISNVPGALFFSDFTNNWKALLWGVSVGGLGNLVGSLASLISYRLYSVKFRNSSMYLVKFHLYNYTVFFLGILTYFLMYTPIFR